MILDRAEQVELSGLLVRAHRGEPLTKVETRRMRALVGKGNPKAADFPLEQLVSAGLIVLAAIWFMGWGEEVGTST